ncbi:MAG: hypothetical protein HY903_21845 [Deltaproteobacteria bacterium]|nr:hypothetical protein [Deltaproteobacteria bacterium]
MGEDQDSKKARRKGTGHPPPSSNRGTSVTLPNAAMKVGALAWGHDDRFGRSITHEELLASLTTFHGAMTTDLVLCAGTRIRLGATTEPWTNEDPPREIARAIFTAAGRPVLLEWPIQPRAMRPHRWLLATAAGFKEIREGQYVFESGPPKAKVAQVLGEMNRGFGTITLKDGDREVSLVLVICNEARIFDAVGNARARLRHAWGAEDIPPVFRNPWVMLHPSHKPYWSASKRSGRGLVAPWVLKTGQTARRPHFSLITTRRRASNGPMILPVQVIHAGPFRRDQAEEPAFSVCGFRGGAQTRAAPLQRDVPGVGAARYVELDV